MQQPEVRALEYDPSSRSRRRESIFLAFYISSPVFSDATDDRIADDGREPSSLHRVRGTAHHPAHFAGITDLDDGLAAVAEATSFIGVQPVGGDTMTLTDVTDTRYDRKIVEAFKQMTAANRPIVRAAAIVSNSSIHRAAISMIALFSRRKLQVFDSRAQALDWLVTQG